MDKREMRTRLLSERQAIDPQQWQRLSLAICAQIRAWKGYEQYSPIGLYRSFRQEPDLSSLLSDPTGQGGPRRFYFPRIDMTSRHMQFYPGEAGFETSAWGLEEPHVHSDVMPLEEQTLLIVPALAYDRRGYRLGYGKGFYDRFLSSHPLMTVGVCFHQQLQDALPTEAHDVPVRFVLTERGLILPSQAEPQPSK